MEKVWEEELTKRKHNQNIVYKIYKNNYCMPSQLNSLGTNSKSKVGSSGDVCMLMDLRLFSILHR